MSYYKILNHTPWLTVDLRRFVTRAARATRAAPRGRVVIVFHSQFKNLFGVARWMPTTGPALIIYMGEDHVEKGSLAVALCNALDRQVNHVKNDWKPEQLPWAADLPMRLRPIRTKTRLVGLALFEHRRRLTMESIERWSVKAKRANNALRKLRAKARYYDRRIEGAKREN